MADDIANRLAHGLTNLLAPLYPGGGGKMNQLQARLHADAEERHRMEADAEQEGTPTAQQGDSAGPVTAAATAAPPTAASPTTAGAPVTAGAPATVAAPPAPVQSSGDSHSSAQAAVAQETFGVNPALTGQEYVAKPASGLASDYGASDGAPAPSVAAKMAEAESEVTPVTPATATAADRQQPEARRQSPMDHDDVHYVSHEMSQASLQDKPAATGTSASEPTFAPRADANSSSMAAQAPPTSDPDAPATRIPAAAPIAVQPAAAPLIQAQNTEAELSSSPKPDAAELEDFEPTTHSGDTAPKLSLNLVDPSFGDVLALAPETETGKEGV